MISYEPLFKTMKKKKISSYGLKKKGFPYSNYRSIKKGKGITTQTIDQLCVILNCEVSDIIQHVKEEKAEESEKD